MTYRFKFSGELAGKATVKRVKTNLARAFKVGEAELDGLFNGEQEFVRENLDKTAADSYASLFKRAGALATISQMSDQSDHSGPTSKRAQRVSSKSSERSANDIAKQGSATAPDADLDNPYAPQQSLASRNRKSQEQASIAVKKSN